MHVVSLSYICCVTVTHNELLSLCHMHQVLSNVHSANEQMVHQMCQKSLTFDNNSHFLYSLRTTHTMALHVDLHTF